MVSAQDPNALWVLIAIADSVQIKVQRKLSRGRTVGLSHRRTVGVTIVIPLSRVDGCTPARGNSLLQALKWTAFTDGPGL